ncbi:MAG TPA: DNA polymerase IV [Baekduia sp.]|nr:DNA polymerase IV [Baekduia sp.]
MAKRVIAHLDCDAFFATVELTKRPELKGKPVIVSHDSPRAVVTTASYEARKFGVGSAMATSRALRLCPDAILVSPDFESYSTASKAVWGIVRTRLAVVQQAGIDEAYADLTDIVKPLKVLREIIAEVHDATGIQLSVGIGPNRLIAKIASDLDKPAGFVAIGREQACELLAGSSLRIIPGIGPKSAERLAASGLTTLGELQAAPEQELIGQFGERQGRWLHARAFLHDDSPLVTSRVLKSRSSETTFDVDVNDLSELQAVIRRQAGRLAQDLQTRDLQGRTIGIKVRLDDWTNVTRARTLGAPVNDEATIAGVACELLRNYAPPRPVRLIGVRVAGFEAAAEAEPVRRAQLALPV